MITTEDLQKRLVEIDKNFATLDQQRIKQENQLKLTNAQLTQLQGAYGEIKAMISSMAPEVQQPAIASAVVKQKNKEIPSESK